MSNISRRNFLKGAGVAALAVAAAGVLAGCSKGDVPSDPVPGEKNVEVTLVYYYQNKTNELARQTVEINAAAAATGKLDTRKYALPATVDSTLYHAENGELPIENGFVFIKVVDNGTAKKQTVKIKYYNKAATAAATADPTEVVIANATAEVTVEAGRTVLDEATIKGLTVPATSGYKIATSATDLPVGWVNGAIENGVAKIYVKKI